MVRILVLMFLNPNPPAQSVEYSADEILAKLSIGSVILAHNKDVVGL